MVKKSLILVISVLMMLTACNRAETVSSVEPIITETSTLANEEISPTTSTSGEEATVTVASSQRTETPTATLTPEPTRTQEPRIMTPEQEAAYALLDRDAEKSTSMEEYPMAWTGEFTGESEGIRVTFSLGFSEMVKNNYFHPVDGIEMTQKGIDAQVDNWLKLCHYRYKYSMSTDISYEDYIKLLKQPEGGEIYMPVRQSDENGNWEVIWRYIDPRAGFAINYYPEAEEMPIKVNNLVTERVDGPMESNGIYAGFVMGVMRRMMEPIVGG